MILLCNRHRRLSGSGGVVLTRRLDERVEERGGGIKRRRKVTVNRQDSEGQEEALPTTKD